MIAICTQEYNSPNTSAARFFCYKLLRFEFPCRSTNSASYMPTTRKTAFRVACLCRDILETVVASVISLVVVAANVRI